MINIERIIFIPLFKIRYKDIKTKWLYKEYAQFYKDYMVDDQDKTQQKEQTNC